MLTYRYRIKDSNDRTWLKGISGKVNYTWNLVQETKLNHHKETGKWLSYKELCKIIKIEGINAQSVQKVIKQYTLSCIQFRKAKLRWRSGKKNLGWIPCTNQNIKIDVNAGTFKYMGRSFKTWYDRPLTGKVMQASFNEDSRGRWYINITCETEIKLPHGERITGIDLGCKDQIVCSDEIKYSRPNLTKEFAPKLAKVQRANKKRQTKKVHAKIKNRRNDWNHKVTTEICKTSKIVVVGDIGAKGLCKTRIAKSVFDTATFQIRSMFSYKSIRHDMVYHLVSEKFSTITCSGCSARSGPSGLSMLGVRHWKCSECGARHDRDVNAARNILMSVKGI